MTKTANKAAIKAMPALRASLLWFKRETVRSIKRAAEDTASPTIRAALNAKASKVRAMDLADLRDMYIASRTSEIRAYRRAELSAVVPGMVWL